MGFSPATPPNPTWGGALSTVFTGGPRLFVEGVESVVNDVKKLQKQALNEDGKAKK